MKFEQHVSQNQKQVQSQKLVLTQQLQQSLQVLHFSIEELNQFIQAKSLENPLIELKEANYSTNYSKPKNANGQEMDSLIQIPDRKVSLFEHLIQQIHLNYRDTYLRTLVLFLVEYIDLNGYLKITLEEVQQKTGVEYIQLLDALTLIQRLDPAGVGARNLQECLMLQTERDQLAPNLAYLVLEEYFEAFAERKWEKIAKALDCTLADIQQIFDYVQTLTPTPGASYGSTEGLYIIPDLSVKIVEGKLVVTNNRQGVPELKFHQQYFERLKQNEDKEVDHYLNQKLQEFENLQKAIVQRGDTVLAVGKYLIEHQQAFFFDENRPLQPLTMREVADDLQIHESTVSRAVNGKYLECEFGIFELKQFFVQKLSTSNGEEIANTSIKEQLKQFIEQEDKRKPLSDQKIVELFEKIGVEISRRTVAKYRDALHIPSSAKRKRYDE